jgi:hypothetical protein
VRSFIILAIVAALCGCASNHQPPAGAKPALTGDFTTACVPNGQSDTELLVVSTFIGTPPGSPFSVRAETWDSAGRRSSYWLVYSKVFANRWEAQRVEPLSTHPFSVVNVHPELDYDFSGEVDSQVLYNQPQLPDANG